jgi:hypothetical protein
MAEVPHDRTPPVRMPAEAVPTVVDIARPGTEETAAAVPQGPQTSAEAFGDSAHAHSEAAKTMSFETVAKLGKCAYVNACIEKFGMEGAKEHVEETRETGILDKLGKIEMPEDDFFSAPTLKNKLQSEHKSSKGAKADEIVNQQPQKIEAAAARSVPVEAQSITNVELAKAETGFGAAISNVPKPMRQEAQATPIKVEAVPLPVAALAAEAIPATPMIVEIHQPLSDAADMKPFDNARESVTAEAIEDPESAVAVDAVQSLELGLDLSVNK